MKDKKRTFVLLGILIALGSYAIPNVIMNKESVATTSSNQTKKVAVNNSNNDKDKIIKNGNTVNASKNPKAINKDKLEIDNLMSDSYSLKTATAENNPFKSPVNNQNTPAKETPSQPVSQNQLPKTIGVNGNDIGNNFTAVPNDVANAPQPKKETPMALKAIAQTSNKIIAVIDYGGKKSSAFIGTEIGDYLVTDIDSEHVYLQDEDGNTRVLDLAK